MRYDRLWVLEGPERDSSGRAVPTLYYRGWTTRNYAREDLRDYRGRPHKCPCCHKDTLNPLSREMYLYTRSSTGRAWVLFDMSNSNGAKAYVWVFSSRGVALDHMTLQNENPNNARLVGPYRMKRERKG
jgi:hypothetical protein